MTQSHQPNNHTAFKTLPIVDITGLYSEQYSVRKATAKTLDKAARDAGFLYLTGHGIPQQVIEALKHRAKIFFEQPLAEKQKAYIGNSVNHSGYVPMGEERFYNSDQIDAKEAYDIGFELDNLELQKPMLGPNQWPELVGFNRDIQGYYDEVLALSRVLFRGFALALDLEEHYFDPHLSHPANQLRLIHYFFNPDQKEDQPGIGAHTDYEFFTLLLPTSPGLQVMNGAGEWIDVPIVPNAFVMNIGDMMEIFTNGEYVATSHRVKKVRQERYSFPMFCNLNYETEVAPLPSFCKQNGARYDSVICGEHLFAQTVQTFQYLQKRLANGELSLPSEAIKLSSFGHLKPHE